MKLRSELIVNKEVKNMPKAICIKCGKVWYGWALKYKNCFCDCGEKLKIIKEDIKNNRSDKN